ITRTAATGSIRTTTPSFAPASGNLAPVAADEFRVEVNLDDEAHGHPFSERLAALDLDDEVAERLGDRVIVTRDGARMFVYTQSREACAEAERVVRGAPTEGG